MCCKKKEPEVREDVIQYVNEEVNGGNKSQSEATGNERMKSKGKKSKKVEVVNRKEQGKGLWATSS